MVNKNEVTGNTDKPSFYRIMGTEAILPWAEK